MKWYRYTIHTSEEAEDAVLGLLYTLGIEGAEIEDKKPVDPEANGGLFGEVLPELPEDDHVSAISFYTKETGEDEIYQNGVGISESGVPDDSPELIEKIRSGLRTLREFIDTGEGSISRADVRDEDWAGKWKEYFHPFFVDDVLVEPEWESDKEAESKAFAVIRIDPGAAFGTGTHESTRLAMEGVRKYTKKGMRVLDIGTGSGILGILALKCGASFVCGTDIDENAINSASENIALNNISKEDFKLAVGDVAKDEALREKIGGKSFDLVCANLIAEIIAGMAPQIPKLLKSGGIFIASGILTERRDIAEKACLAAGLELTASQETGEWTSLIFRMKHF